MNVDVITNSDGSSSKNENGSVQYFFTVEDGEALEIEMTFDNQEGTIGVYIAKNGVEGDADFSEEDISSGTYSVTVSKAGTYQMLYRCNNYIGEYSYSLQVK